MSSKCTSCLIRMQLEILQTARRFRNLQRKHLRTSKFKAIWAKDKYSTWTRYSKCNYRYSRRNKSWLLLNHQPIQTTAVWFTIPPGISISHLSNLVAQDRTIRWTRFNPKACTFILIPTKAVPSTNDSNKVARPREAMAVRVNLLRIFILCRWEHIPLELDQQRQQTRQVLHLIRIICRRRTFSKWVKAKKFIRVAHQATWKIARALKNLLNTHHLKSCNLWILLAIFQQIKWCNSSYQTKMLKFTTQVNYRYSLRVVAAFFLEISSSRILLSSKWLRIIGVREHRRTKVKAKQINKNGEIEQYLQLLNKLTLLNLQPLWLLQ